jgi:nitroimidazol reductase NimA-like FMN-containing flavoprotein (pyridoxamine 5'-phosphate oxidase superfamily)
VQHLSQSAIDRLLARRLIASLATLDEDGGIHVVPMWYRSAEGSLLFPTSGKTRKVRNLRQSPSATAMVQFARGGPNVCGVMIRGPVEVVSGDEARQLNRSIHLRYVTAKGLRQRAVANLLNGDDMTLRLLIQDVVSWKISAGKQPEPNWSRPLA